jgi:hypothetical protein
LLKVTIIAKGKKTACRHAANDKKYPSDHPVIILAVAGDQPRCNCTHQNSIKICYAIPFNLLVHFLLALELA